MEVRQYKPTVRLERVTVSFDYRNYESDFNRELVIEKIFDTEKDALKFIRQCKKKYNLVYSFGRTTHKGAEYEISANF